MSLADQRELARREVGWRRSASDPRWLAENCWMIQHPQGERLFALREAQVEALGRWVGGENSITLKARQIGWSTLVAFFVFWLAFFSPGVKILLLSRGEREAQELLGKVQFGLDRLPGWLRERGPNVVRANLTTITFDNGSEIVSLPSGSNPARGFTGRLVVADEFAFLENDAKAWASMEPVTDIGGQLIVLSTANGVGNTFHDLWNRSQDPRSMFEPMFFGWDAVVERTDEWYAAKQRDLPEWQLHQEYPTAPDEAFIKSGMLVFNSDVLDDARDAAVDPLWVGNLDGPGSQFPYTFEPLANKDGFLLVWERPDPLSAYVIGADVAEGLEHGDYSCAYVVRVGDDPRVVAEWHGHTSADLYGFELFKLGVWFNTALIMLEINNHGLTTMTELRRLGYRRLWRRMALNSVSAKRQMEWGWRTTSTTKPLMIDELGSWMREDPSRVVSKPLAGELFTFVRDGRGRMNGSPHDDRVISAALAVQGLKYAHAPEFQEEVEPAVGTLDWYERELQVLENTDDSEEWMIGAR